MNQIYKFLFTMVVVLFMGHTAIGQDTLNVAGIQKDASASTWHLLSTSGSAKIYYQYVDCGTIEFVNFKLENSSNQAINVSWNFSMFLNGTALNSNPDDVNFDITVAANSSVASGCFTGQYPGMSVFIREANTNFKLNKIVVANLTVN